MEASQTEPTEQDPAPGQSAGVTGERTITGDHGMQPQPVADDSVNRPVASSAPPPESQSGIPLAEDRAAGVTPGESSTLPGVQETPTGEKATASPEEAREATETDSLDPAAGTEAQQAADHVNPAGQGSVT